MYKTLIPRVAKLYTCAIALGASYGQPVLLLIMRLWMARIFWYSGLTKIADWQATVYLFSFEYNVPILPPELAAIFATCFELCCPPLLTFGLAARLATLPLLAMTAVIQFTYLPLMEHGYWAMLLATILLLGPGKLSLDYLLHRRFEQLS